ncbi:hypothetical protein YYC_05812 [Plasmodium yoelii 17X]|uniref:Uncharacterized protein n=1 Tax=Plasmodium yoelii 17X TaxID=1323249 RepID=V7PDF6_PLAYE|nr:hypothetical protein YYC_05812 [Plasmodium yoelii 17X]
MGIARNNILRFSPIPPELNDKWSDGRMDMIGINYKVLFGGNIYGREDKLRVEARKKNEKSYKFS